MMNFSVYSRTSNGKFRVKHQVSWRFVLCLCHCQAKFNPMFEMDLTVHSLQLYNDYVCIKSSYSNQRYPWLFLFN